MDNELYHYGIKGMKWGVRRYQNKDGRLTKVGKKDYQKKQANIINEKLRIEQHLEPKEFVNLMICL